MMLPRLYPILDRAFLPRAPRERLDAVARYTKLWAEAGIEILQYRNKSSSGRESLADAGEIVRVLYSINKRDKVRLVMNDRADLCVAADFEGVHIGQDDLAPEHVRKIIGAKRFYGLSCHNEAQIEAAERTDADYLAIGPIFATSSKTDPDPIVGLDRLRAIRRLTRKPLVGIGGIDRRNCRSVIDAGADSVAVISDLFRGSDNSVTDFLRILR